MGKNSAGREAKRARQEEKAREEMVKKGTASIRAMFDKNFNQDYYDKAYEEQKGKYKTDFDSQWETARKSLEAALMRAGLYDSTEGIARRKDALDIRNRREVDYQSAARAAVEGRKQNVIAAQDNVIGQLRSSADLNAATSAATQQLAAQTAPIPYSPLGSVFTDLTAGLATQADQERQGTNRYNLGISTWANPNRYTRNVG